MSVPEMPDVHATVVGITNPKSGESIATAAATAALELLRKVKTEQRASLVLDRVAIVQPVDLGGAFPMIFPGQVASHVVVVTCREVPQTPAPAA